LYAFGAEPEVITLFL